VSEATLLSRRIKRCLHIVRNEGAVAAARTVARECLGQLRYKWLRLTRSQGLCERSVQGSRMRLPIDDPGISRDLIIRGMRERYETKMIREVLRPGMTVVDIGANIGYYALLEARSVTESGQVYAIEPEPRNVELLKDNVSLNGYRHVHVDQAAVGDETGFAQLYRSTHRNLHNLLRPLKGDHSVVDVRICRLDDLLAERGVDLRSVNLIRMDIEGYEAKALAGMAKTLELATELTLFIEFHPLYIAKLPGCSLEKTMGMLEESGFQMEYATATARDGESLEFRKTSIAEFLSDERVSRDDVFFAFLKKTACS